MAQQDGTVRVGCEEAGAPGHFSEQNTSQYSNIEYKCVKQCLWI